MTGALDLLTETLRQQRTGDTLYHKRLPPIFELQVPARVVTGGIGSSFLLPLPMPPQEIDEEYPFAAEITHTADGGIVVEENGVPTVELRLRGTMGQRPKLYRGSYFGLIRPAERRLSQHDVVDRTMAGYAITGHRWLLQLKHAIFGMYADLKSDPELAEETRLILHLPKDGTHYVVVPRSFRMPRSIGTGSTVWHYEIVLTATELAKAVHLPTEDRSLLATMLNGVAAVRSAIRLARSVLRDLSLIRSQIERQVRQISGVLNDIAGVIEEGAQFIDGTRQSISSARARFESGIDRLEAAIEDVGELVGDDVAHLLGLLSDSMAEIMLHPGLFEPQPQEVVDAAFRRGLGLLAERSRESLETAAAGDPPATEQALRDSDALPGDLTRDDRSRELPEDLRQYRSAFEATVDEEDTIEALAARYLGDARRARHIVILNALREPYISPHGLPGTIRPGERILIPSVAAPARRSANPAVLGADPRDAVAVRELGRDWRVSFDVDGGEDWLIDEAGGSVDLQVAEGIECLAQDLVARIDQPRGADPLYRTLGIERVIGLGVPAIEGDAVRLRVSEALEADPRVEQATEVTLEQPTPDTLGVTARVAVRGLREPVTVQASTVPPASP